jgi:hypothetical protein
MESTRQNNKATLDLAYHFEIETSCTFVHFVFDIGIVLFIQAKVLPISPWCYCSSHLQYGWIPWRRLPSVPSQVT